MHVSDLLVEAVLKEQFGLDELRPHQKEVIGHILEERHTLALLPTGYGKSLCYQLPSQVLPGATLVVSPLIALMRDQVNGLLKRGINNATFLNSSIDFQEQTERIDGIKSGAYKLVYVAPERFESPRFRTLLSQLKISLLVIDEAHCISHWGHDFRPHYRNLSSYLSHVPGATILALTATATPAVQKDIVDSLKLPQMQVVIGSFDRPNLHLEVVPARDAYTKDQEVMSRLSADPGSCIIYTSSRRETERLSMQLKTARFKAAYYHAGLGSGQRDIAQEHFQSGKTKVIVCTVAFGMGIDKPDISRVIHYNLPPSIENYYQEAGRAGRDGNQATCTLLYQAKDIYTQRWLVDRNYPSGKQVLAVLEYLRQRTDEPVRLAEIVENVDIADTAVNSALDLLKQQKLIDVNANGQYFPCLSHSDLAPVDMSLLQKRRQLEEHRLEQVINYANNASCRRSYILRYFGQQLSTQCSGCDNCHPSQKPAPTTVHYPTPVADRKKSKNTKPSSLSESILQLVQEFNGRSGRTTIAAILTGGKSQKLIDGGLDKSHHYGSLAGIKRDLVIEAIDELIAQGCLTVSSGLYPKVSITAAGLKILAANVS